MAFQRQYWHANEYGILKKKEENEEELLVFGYSCKLFRDDEKALHIDQGKHLIPWMGDDSLRIDRYDVRGALYDLSQFEAVSGQQEELFWVNLSNEERRIEQLCDEERYRALTHNEDEEALYQEEELKRLQQAIGGDKTYGQVSYSYDDENGEKKEEMGKENNQTEESDEPFVVPKELEVPADMVVPETTKLNAIIEKTAMFINQQGLQMEIILKMKQASNPQFEFLSYNSPLHGYYRHLFNAIKSGRYKPKLPSSSSTDNQNNEETNSVDQNNYYLHHSLTQIPSSSFNLAPSIPSINYKPSSDCAYSMLVNKIRGNQNKFSLLNKVGGEATSELTEPQIVESNEPDISSSPKSYEPLETVDENNSNDAMKQLDSPMPIAQVQRPSRRKRRKRKQGGFVYNDSFEPEQELVDATEFMEPEPDVDTLDELENAVTPEEPEDEYEVPPPDLQLIIEKMACYVAKNGRDFEEIVKSKNDPRFSFLDGTNPYYMFYRRKVEHFEQGEPQPINSVNTEISPTDDNNVAKSYRDYNVENGDVSNVPDTQTINNKISTIKPNPVCFSIKRPKETEGLEIKSALPIEESSDDENEGTEDAGNDGKDVADTNNVGEPETNVKHIDKNTYGIVEKQKDERVKEKSTSSGKEKSPSLLKDKVGSPPKEKLSAKEREKLLQMERKKRAAAFLNLIKKANKKSPEKTETSVMIGPQLPEDMKISDKTDSTSANEDENDSDSVSSPPSSVTSPDVTFVSEEILGEVNTRQKDVVQSEQLIDHKIKGSRRSSSSSKYSASRHLRESDIAAYRHKHRKRKRSRTPVRKHLHSSRSHLHRSNKESKHRKHHHQNRKEWRRSDRDYTISSSGGTNRRHKHYKYKKHKRKDDKKLSSSKSSVSDELDSD